MAFKRILITTGDQDGIGPEITRKALNALGPQTGVQFFFYRAPTAKSKPWTRKFKSVTVADLPAALQVPFHSKTVIEIANTQSPAHWVEEAAQGCLRADFQAMVTAPLSKITIKQAGFKDIGHTEILARVSGTRDLFMGFHGQKFSVLLATGHASLATAIKSLTPTLLLKAVEAAEQLRLLLPTTEKRRPLALVGLNPHAGEEGLIGREEEWFRGFLTGLQPRLQVAGPLVPDAAFLPQNWPRYSVYICPYHDQGLIPFKLVHGFKSGVHLTLGLPFVRTSVDHGTAKELYGKNQAEFGSMRDALTAAIRLSKGSKQ